MKVIAVMTEEMGVWGKKRDHHSIAEYDGIVVSFYFF